MKVKNLIEKLSTFPPDALIIIQDPDTSWILKISENQVHYDVSDNTVCLMPDYGDGN